MNAKTAVLRNQLAASITIAFLAAAVAIAAFAVTTSASATTSYTPSLTNVAPAAVKVSLGDSAGYTAARTVTARRAAQVRTASAKRKAVARRRAAVAARGASGGELGRAQAILDSLIAKHPILKGATVQFGDARGYQAVAYYSSGRIIISRTHTASLERILNHEVWHIIDYRDNGTIDWGENVPR